MVFRKVAKKGYSCVIGVCNASYNQENQSVAEEILMLGSKTEKTVAPMVWKSSVIRKICTSLKVEETRGVMKSIDDKEYC